MGILDKIKKMRQEQTEKQEVRRKRDVIMKRQAEQARYEGRLEGRRHEERRRGYYEGKRAATPLAEKVAGGIVAVGRGLGSVMGPAPPRRRGGRRRKRRQREQFNIYGF